MQQGAARSSDEEAIRQTVASWSAAAGARELNKCVSFYTDDALGVPEPRHGMDCCLAHNARC
jgi:ketosteroid isomerase-like protein